MKKTFGICLSLMAATLFMEMACRAGEQQGTGMVYQAAGAGNLQFADAPHDHEETAGVALSDLVHRKPADDMLRLDDSEKEILLRISAAEANTEGVIGKALVMRVVLNRIESMDFPDTVAEVVFEHTAAGRYEFSPVGDGSYWDAEVTKECHDALDLVLSGWDGSHGATYFCTPESAWWHEGSLEYLFRCGNHRFYVGKGGDEN